MTGGRHAALPRQPRVDIQEGGDQSGQCVPGLPPGQQGHCVWAQPDRQTWGEGAAPENTLVSDLKIL